MKDSHVTLRLSPELARTLARWARDRGMSKSHVVREAVATYLRAPPVDPRGLTAAELAERWSTLPRLAPDEAGAFADDLNAARRELPAPDAWE